MEFLESLGYLGLFLGSFLASTIFPFSSDFLFVGTLLAGGNYIISFIVATIGNWLGGLTSYYVGYLGKWDWIEKWFRIKEASLVRQKSRIERYGSLIAFLSWVPFAGDVLSVGLGFYRINFTKCAVYMLIGRAVRFIFWLLLYHYFGEAVLNMKFL